MSIFAIVLMALSFVALVAASLVVNVPKVNLIAVGLALWELAQVLIQQHFGGA
ncbi:hypothetical protein AB3X94_37305 [Paraburkholderia sp. BR10923]|uniref:hypothetical protein n=1 Tax=Paraburkholderia sp. BR10923 TaxID=3236992 RepID=UPI0034CE8974